MQGSIQFAGIQIKKSEPEEKQTTNYNDKILNHLSPQLPKIKVALTLKIRFDWFKQKSCHRFSEILTLK